MKAVLMIGSHYRHLYVAKTLMEAGYLQAVMIEEREHLVPSPPAQLSTIDHDNFIRHFADREAAEQKAFGRLTKQDLAGVPLYEVTQEGLNENDAVQWLQQQNPEAVISFGIHKLEQAMLEVLPDLAWNIHGGLSPWYKGNITLFWPFYFLKPNWAGMTIHQLTSRLDGGDIIHHSVPELMYGDGIHDVASRAVVQAAHDLVNIFKLLDQGVSITPQKQKSNGKLFVGTDWKPQHLRLIYNHFNNDIVDRFLDGELGADHPPLVKAFD